MQRKFQGAGNKIQVNHKSELRKRVRELVEPLVLKFEPYLIFGSHCKQRQALVLGR